MRGEADVDGTAFGRYRLLQVLGRGGMGEVWRAHDTATDRVVAVKLLPAHLADDESFVQRFRREAHAAARLNSPHVIPIHNYGEIDGRLYVDMRLIEGRDLQTVLADGPLEPARAVRIIEQVAKALHAAHKVGLVHRDVKPSNILLDEDDFAYLIDFGIARAAADTRLTGTGGMIGTLHYMAPERLSSGEVDARSDIYALACVLYECLTGSRPFPGDGLERQIAAHLTDPPPQPSSTHLDLPQDFDAVIARGMAKDPRQRYATTVELANAAHDAITTPIPQPAPSPPPRPPAPTQAAGTFASAATQQARSHDVAAQQRPPSIPPAHPPPLPTPRRWWRRKTVMISAAAVSLAAIVVVTAVIITGTQNQNSAPPLPQQTAAPRQTVLAFTGLDEPYGVAVDSAGTVYVANFRHNQVVSLAAGPSSPTALGFTGLNDPDGVAVDSSGTVYVTDFNRVAALAAGASSPTVLGFTGLNDPAGVAVDSTGTVYVTDFVNHRVVALAAGSSPTVLGFTGLDHPAGVAVDRARTVYVTDTYHNQVVALAAGASSPTVLRFTGLNRPWGVAVDSAGTVYITDSFNDRVVALAAGASSPTVLGFTGLSYPRGVAVDSTGTVYVADSGNNRVVALAQA
jgi:serine/threonine-protein kinase